MIELNCQNQSTYCTIFIGTCDIQPVKNDAYNETPKIGKNLLEYVLYHMYVLYHLFWKFPGDQEEGAE
jgi:hypothetical protein